MWRRRGDAVVVSCTKEKMPISIFIICVDSCNLKPCQHAPMIEFVINYIRNFSKVDAHVSILFVDTLLYF